MNETGSLPHVVTKVTNSETMTQSWWKAAMPDKINVVAKSE